MATTINNLRDWQLRSELPVLNCGGGTVQFGLDRRWALRLGELKGTEVRWLQTAAKKQSQLRRSAASFGVSESRAIQICGTLARGGVLMPPQPEGLPLAEITEATPPSPISAGGSTDLPALSALRPDANGQATLDRRALSRVLVSSSGRLGAAIAIQLAQAGVGHLQLPDQEEVTTDELGAYAANDVGKPRKVAIRRRIAELGLRPDLSLKGTPDVTISIETGTQGAAYFTTLHQATIPYLAVAVGEAEVEVGPFVLPDRSACTHCLQLTRATHDEQWAILVAEMANLEPRPVETVLVTAAASFIVGQVLTFLDGGQPRTINALATLALPQAIPEFVHVSPNPNCGCVTVPPPLAE